MSRYPCVVGDGTQRYTLHYGRILSEVSSAVVSWIGHIHLDVYGL